MADNVDVTPGTGATIATDDIGGAQHQRVKLSLGANGTAVDAGAGAGAVGTDTQRVTLGSDDPAVASLAIMDDWDESDRAKVNIIVGQAGVAAGNGASGATVPRVAIAQDNNFATPIKWVDVTFTVPTGALAAGDVAAATQVVAACTRGDDMPGILHSVVLIDPDDQKAKLRIVLFDANTTLGTEDAAPDIDDTEILTVQGHVDIAVADYVDLGGASYAQRDNLGKLVKPATGTDDIYAAIYIPDTSAPTYAGGNITVRFGFIH